MFGVVWLSTFTKPTQYWQKFMEQYGNTWPPLCIKREHLRNGVLPTMYNGTIINEWHD